MEGSKDRKGEEGGFEDILDSVVSEVTSGAAPASIRPDASAQAGFRDLGREEALRILSGISSWKEGERLLGQIADVGLRAKTLAAIFEGITVARPGAIEGLMGGDRTRKRTVGYLRKMDAEGFRSIRAALSRQGPGKTSGTGNRPGKKKT